MASRQATSASDNAAEETPPIRLNGKRWHRTSGPTNTRQAGSNAEPEKSETFRVSLPHCIKDRITQPPFHAKAKERLKI